ncbi:hypothetical protein, partial [Rhizobium sp. PDO1-076]|uniref:hypothetical protein n=1 Tax=Rhizobium sp. PDO1-076 TaxID=1125979 RepID=UPI001AEC36CD
MRVEQHSHIVGGKLEASAIGNTLHGDWIFGPPRINARDPEALTAYSNETGRRFRELTGRHRKLNGGNASERRHPEISVMLLQFSPTGSSP